MISNSRLVRSAKGFLSIGGDNDRSVFFDLIYQWPLPFYLAARTETEKGSQSILTLKNISLLYDITKATFFNGAVLSFNKKPSGYFASIRPLGILKCDF